MTFQQTVGSPDIYFSFCCLPKRSQSRFQQPWWICICEPPTLPSLLLTTEAVDWTSGTVCFFFLHRVNFIYQLLIFILLFRLRKWNTSLVLAMHCVNFQPKHLPFKLKTTILIFSPGNWLGGFQFVFDYFDKIYLITFILCSLFRFKGTCALLHRICKPMRSLTTYL